MIVLVCLEISPCHVIKASCDFMGGNLIVSHHTGKFSDHRHFGSRDKIFYWLESKIFHARINSPLLFIFKAHSMLV